MNFHHTMSDDNKCSFRYLRFDKDWSVVFKINALLELNRYSNYGSKLGKGVFPTNVCTLHGKQQIQMLKACLMPTWIQP